MKFASQQEIALFRKRGYIVIRNAFSKRQIFSFQQALESLVNIFFKKNTLLMNANALSCDEKIIALKNKNPMYISIIQRIISRSPEFYALAACTNIMSFMRSLYDLQNTSPVYIVNNGIVFTCPNDSHNKAVSNFETDWHNDIFYTIPHSQFWQIWLPLLHSANVDIGTLMVCPGSHKHGVGKQRINIHTDYNHRYTIDPTILSQYSPESVEVPLGDILIFDSRLIHKSGINTSSQVRCTMLGAYHDASKENFSPLGFEYKYYGKTPESYFYELFGDEDAKNIMFENAADTELPIKNGV